MASIAKGQTSATGTLSSASLGGGLFDYTITLDNTGSTDIQTFWYAWTPGQDYMLTSPTAIVSPTGWSDIITGGGSTDGYAIQWKSSATPLADGSSFTFSFDSTDTPAQMAGDASFFPNTPVGTSVIYSGLPFSGTEETFVVDSIPEPSPSGLLGLSALAIIAWRFRRPIQAALC